MTGAPLVVGIDVGGTKVLAAEVDDTGQVLRTARRETPGRLVDVRLVEDALTAVSYTHLTLPTNREV